MNGFTEMKTLADSISKLEEKDQYTKLAFELFESKIHQERMLAVLLFEKGIDQDKVVKFLKQKVSEDPDWRVQEMLARAFDARCKFLGYENSIELIKEWITDKNSNCRRAVSEGLRIWTTRQYFKENPQIAIDLLAHLKADESEYVRKSCGNALRDISRKFPELVEKELKTWNLDDKKILQTYKLASQFLYTANG